MKKSERTAEKTEKQQKKYEKPFFIQIKLVADVVLGTPYAEPPCDSPPQ